MSDASADAKIGELSAKVDDLVLGLKWMFALFLIVLSIPNFCVSLSIHHFSEIFQDALPGKPLPLLTVAIIEHRILHHMLTLAWPLFGVLNIWYGKRIRNWTIGTALFAFFIGLQLCLTWMALFEPMVQLISGMSDTSAK